MSRLLGILLVMLALTFPGLAQNTGDVRNGKQATGTGLPSDEDGNLFACQHGWAKCNRANLSL
jgi:hypothetical protein